ncbi:MAG: type II secretion system protein [Candidatus Falkowbacteria bacterium]|nr:type II secretion system protein [Candidatus Falkowbacteria bacterium]
MKNKIKGNAGFTLIELLLVIAIIAILAGVIFVALDPLKRFQDSRNSRRWAQVEEVLNAIKINQIDTQGAYPATIAALPNDTVYMISATSTATTTCNLNCGTVASTSACVDLSSLKTSGYLSAIPVSPSSAGLTPNWSSNYTGFTIKKSGAFITISACESEGTATTTIFAQR